MHSLTTPQQIDTFRARVLLKSMEVYLKTDGKMVLTRMATPANMRMWATEYTGKAYPRSRKGLETAAADLRSLLTQLGSWTYATA